MHKAEHTKTCFKKKGQHEGRCNIPNKKCATTELLFNNIDTEWFNWDGSEGTRNLFLINNERIHVDAFANKHNEITSVIFNSNTNVIPGILGACMLYVALYTTKNTTTSRLTKIHFAMWVKLGVVMG